MGSSPAVFRPRVAFIQRAMSGLFLALNPTVIVINLPLFPRGLVVDTFGSGPGFLEHEQALNPDKGPQHCLCFPRHHALGPVLSPSFSFGNHWWEWWGECGGAARWLLPPQPLPLAQNCRVLGLCLPLNLYTQSLCPQSASSRAQWSVLGRSESSGVGGSQPVLASAASPILPECSHFFT